MRTWLIKARGKETQKSVAEKVGISQNFYSCIESGSFFCIVKRAKLKYMN